MRAKSPVNSVARLALAQTAHSSAQAAEASVATTSGVALGRTCIACRIWPTVRRSSLAADGATVARGSTLAGASDTGRAGFASSSSRTSGRRIDGGSAAARGFGRSNPTGPSPGLASSVFGAPASASAASPASAFRFNASSIAEKAAALAAS